MKANAVSDDVFDGLRHLLWLAKDFEEPLAEALEPRAWGATALVGAEVPAERLVRVREGGLGGEGADRDVVVVLVERELRAAPGSWFLAIDPMMDPGDAALAQAGAPHVAVGDTIAYAVRQPDPESIRAAWLQAASAAGRVALLSSRAPGGASSAAEIVDGASLVVFAAYDGEGTLILNRR